MIKTLIAALFLCFSYNGDPVKPDSKFGDIIDVYNEIPVYYNGNRSHTGGRHVTEGGYNLGMKWQCVEFVKRFYFKKFGHRMRNSYGHAKDFFDDSLAHTSINNSRGLTQYKNIDCIIPQINDIVVFGPSYGNPYGHIAIISAIRGDQVEIVQQNVGKKTRENYTLSEYMGIFTIANRSVLGWMRLP